MNETNMLNEDKQKLLKDFAKHILKITLKKANGKVKEDITSAIEKVEAVQASPIFKTGGPQMKSTPHLDKITAALKNRKAKNDKGTLTKILEEYKQWVKEMNSLKSKGNQRIKEMVKLLNKYKDRVEVDLILGEGTSFLIRQKGQLKLDNSIMEEFLVRLMDSDFIEELKSVDFITGPKKAFLSLAFAPKHFSHLDLKPKVVLKSKDQDFILGKEIHYQFSPDSSFPASKTEKSSLILAIIAAECKVNFDKTMFQECCGTATRLKSGLPYAKYFVLVEFLDMVAEDCRLTDVDNVFLIRKAKRLPYEKRNNIKEVRKHRMKHPISSEIIINFVDEIRLFLRSKWYDSEKAVEQGSFI